MKGKRGRKQSGVGRYADFLKTAEGLGEKKGRVFKKKGRKGGGSISWPVVGEAYLYGEVGGRYRYEKKKRNWNLGVRYKSARCRSERGSMTGLQHKGHDTQSETG